MLCGIFRISYTRAFIYDILEPHVPTARVHTRVMLTSNAALIHIIIIIIKICLGSLSVLLFIAEMQIFFHPPRIRDVREVHKTGDSLLQSSRCSALLLLSFSFRSCPIRSLSIERATIYQTDGKCERWCFKRMDSVICSPFELCLAFVVLAPTETHSMLCPLFYVKVKASRFIYYTTTHSSTFKYIESFSW